MAREPVFIDSPTPPTSAEYGDSISLDNPNSVANKMFFTLLEYQLALETIQSINSTKMLRFLSETQLETFQLQLKEALKKEQANAALGAEIVQLDSKHAAAQKDFNATHTTTASTSASLSPEEHYANIIKHIREKYAILAQNQQAAQQNVLTAIFSAVAAQVTPTQQVLLAKGQQTIQQLQQQQSAPLGNKIQNIVNHAIIPSAPPFSDSDSKSVNNVDNYVQILLDRAMFAQNNHYLLQELQQAFCLKEVLNIPINEAAKLIKAAYNTKETQDKISIRKPIETSMWQQHVLEMLANKFKNNKQGLTSIEFSLNNPKGPRPSLHFTSRPKVTDEERQRTLQASREAAERRAAERALREQQRQSSTLGYKK